MSILRSISFRIVALLAACWTSHSNAGVIISVVESGTNVVSTASGSINMTGLSVFNSSGAAAQIRPDTSGGERGSISVGDLAPDSALQYQVSGPLTFGPGTLGFLANSFGGDFVGIRAVSTTGALLQLPSLYNSGDSINGTATFNSQSFASLGVTTGTYNYTWGSGPDADFLTINIGAAPVPEPSTMCLFAGVLGLAACQRRRRARSELKD